MSKGSSSAGKLKDYFGDIGGVVCAGPVDELVSIIIDGATVWPTNDIWADGVDALPVISYSRKTNVAKITFNVPHTCRKGQKIMVSNMPDATFDLGAPTAILAASDLVIKYTNFGPDVATTAVPQNTGIMTKSVHYTVGFLVAYLGTIWQCILLNDGTPTNAPPNATYWQEYSLKRATSPNPVPLTVAGKNHVTGATFNYGTGWFYWGTSTQTLDAGSTLLAAGHPPYRNQAVLELHKFYFGTEVKNAPNVEVVVRRAPAQAVIAGASTNLDADHQCNPLVAGAALMADAVFGIGQPAGLLDATSWQATADALAAIAADAYVSVLLDSDMTMREFLSQLLAYFDGWVRFNGSAVIEAGRFLHNTAPPAFTAATTLDMHDAQSEMAYDCDGYSSTANETMVRFADRARAFKSASLQFVSSLNRNIVGEPRKVSLERPWIARELQATRHAAEYGKINAQPNLEGRLIVRTEKATQIKQGDVFKLSNDALAYAVVCRCTDRTIAAPLAGRVTLGFKNERGIAPIPYHLPPAGPPIIPIPTNELISIYQFIQPPPDLAGNSDFNLMVLAARTSVLTRGFDLWLRQADGSLFYDLGRQRDFAVQGLLAQNYDQTWGQQYVVATHARSAGTAILVVYTAAPITIPTGSLFSVDDSTDVSFNATNVAMGVLSAAGPPTWAYVFSYANAGPDVAAAACTAIITVMPQDDVSETLQLNLNEFTVQADLDNISATQTADAINDDDLLVFLVSAADPTQFEVCTLIAIRLDAGVYKLKVRRARFGTGILGFVTGDAAFTVYRSDLVNFTQEQFSAYAQSATPADFRIQTYTDRGQADVSDTSVCPDIAFTFADPFAITIQWTDQQKKAPGDADFVDVGNYAFLPNGAVPGGGSTYTSPTQFRVSFELSTPAGTLTDAHLVARLGTQDYVVWSQNFTPSNMQLVTAQFTLTDPGVYRLYIVARDAQGRTAELELPRYHDTVFHEAVIKITSTTEMPVATPKGGPVTTVLSSITVSLATQTAGATVYYQLVNRGQRYVGGAWQVYSGPILVPLASVVRWPTPGSGKTLWAYATNGGVDSPIVRNDYYISSR